MMKQVLFCDQAYTTAITSTPPIVAVITTQRPAGLVMIQQIKNIRAVPTEKEAQQNVPITTSVQNSSKYWLWKVLHILFYNESREYIQPVP
jgi:hypothetical protein